MKAQLDPDSPNDSTTLTRVRRKSVRAQVFEQLRDQIMSQVWRPGTKIPSENTLSETLGVSRVSVREALQMLASLGLVEMRQGGGTFVREYAAELFLNPLTPMLALEKTDVVHVLEYRRVVEKGIVSLVVERAGDVEVARLEGAYRTMEDARADGHAFARADLEFHLALAHATQNPVIIKINEVIKSVLSASMESIVDVLGIEDGLHYHRRILDAIIARDRVTAEELMQEHVERTIDRYAREAAAQHGSEEDPKG